MARADQAIRGRIGNKRPRAGVRWQTSGSKQAALCNPVA